MRRVVITGMAMLHPHGLGRDPLTEALVRGYRPAARHIEALDYKEHFPGTSKRIKKMDTVGRYATVAALLALRDAGLEEPPEPERAGLATGTMFGGLEACASFHQEVLTRGPDHVNPVHFPNTAHNVSSGHVAITLKLQGPALSLSSGLAASHDALIAATRFLRAGRADLVVVGGFDRLIPEIEQGLEATGVLASDLFPCEGACFLVFEEEGHARDRGARVRGRVLSYGQASDPMPMGGYHRRGRALAKALGLALERADGAPDLAAASMASQGLPRYDEAVAAAYETVLGPAFDELPRLEAKQVFGETFGAGGCFQVAAALDAIEHGRLAPGPVLVDGMAWGGSASALVVGP